MTLHICPRCGYQTEKKSNIRNHYKKKKICEAIVCDVSIEECLKGLTKKNSFECKYCDKKFKYKSYLQRHIVYCQSKHIEKLEKQNEMYSKCQEEGKSSKNYVYMIQEREFIKLNEPVYKIGKTSNPKSRLSAYPKGSEVLFISLVSDCHQIEKEIIENFNDKFIHRNDIGKEYFQGDDMEMIQEIIGIIKTRGLQK